MKSENAIAIWVCRIVGSFFLFFGIGGPIQMIIDGKMPEDFPVVGLIFTVLFCLIVGGLCALYGFMPRTKQQMKDSYKAAASSIKDGVIIATVATAAVIDEEMKKKERNKPLTKGDLEDLKAELRRKERGY